MKRAFSVAFLLVALAGSSLSAQAQERVYAAQRAPARIHSFNFSGGAWAREDLAPSNPAKATLDSLLDPFFGVVATDRFFVVGSGFTGLGVDVVDPFTGLELPRVRTTALLGRPILSSDKKWAFLVGASSSQTPTLSVVDLDPASSGFLTERASLVNFANGQVSPDAVALIGSILYVTLTDPDQVFGFAPNAKIVAIDVSNPVIPVVLGQTVVNQTLLVTNPTAFATTGDAAQVAPSALRAFDLGGTTYLFLCRRDLVVLLPDGAGGVSVQGQFFSRRVPVPSGWRFARDVYAGVVGGHRRAYVTADVATAAGLGAAEELLVIDLDTFVVDQAGAKVLSSKTFANPGSGDRDIVHPSLDGTHIYILSCGGGSPSDVARLLSVDLNLPINESSTFPSIDLDGSTNPATGFDVAIAVTPAPAAILSGATVAGATPPNILVNDIARTVTITGSGLGGTTHVFAGTSRLSLGSVSDGSVQATSPLLLPAGNRPLIVVDANGGIASLGAASPGAIAVVNAATFQPPEVAYALALSENTAWELHAANETQVVSSFPVGLGPANGRVTPDGALLLVADFQGANVEAYSLLNDPTHGWTARQKVADLHTGGSPQPMVMKRDGSRVYVGTNDGYVAVIDSAARPPVLIDADQNPGTIDPGVNPALSPGLTRIKVFPAGGASSFRGLALSPDDKWLYVAKNTAPHLAAVHIDNDNYVEPGDVTFYSIPSLPGLPPPANGQRVDGIVVRGSRLYVAGSVDSPPVLRLFDVAGASITPATPPSIAFPAGAAVSIRTLALTPDQKFLYASSRFEGSDPDRSTVYILDAATSTWVTSLGLGTFSGPPVPSPSSNFVYVASAERDIAYTLDARPGASQHTVIAASAAGVGTGIVAVSPGQLTPAGSAVPIAPASNVTLTFDTVTQGGNTTVTSLNVTPVTLPAGLLVLNGNPVYYEIKTTATFVPPVKVCLTYTDEQVMGVDESTLRLMHEEGGIFVDRTIGAPDTDAALNRICGSVSSFSQFTIAIADLVPPQITCGASDGLWHADNVSIACTAVDAGSGLQNAADAGFSLVTSVSAGTEIAAAMTSSRTVCDVAGNCATAGAIGGIKVDRKAPTISITSPAGSYLVGDAAIAIFSCSDGGSGVGTCRGTVASGVAVDTASAGPKTFTVNATDAAGNTTPVTVTYSVLPRERTLCSTLGREMHPRAKDRDVFEFVGVAGELVTLTMAESPNSANSGDDVRLVIEDRIRGHRLQERERGPLPLTIQATLPASGRYVVRVERKNGRDAFRGQYCLTLRSSLNAFATFAPTGSVEP